MFDSFLRTLGYVKKSAESDHPIKNILSYRVKYEYFKEAHEFEIERRERLNSRISLLTTSLAAGAGFVAYYSHGPLPMENGTSMLICALECTAGIYSLFMAAWQSWKVIEEREYAYPPTAEKIRDFLGELEEYNSQVSAMEQEDVEKRLLLELTNMYCECTQINAGHNEVRGRRFRAAVLWSFLAISWFSIALPFFAVNGLLQNSPTSIRIVNPIEVK